MPTNDTSIKPIDPDFAHLKTDGYGPGAKVLCEVCGAKATKLVVYYRRFFCENHGMNDVSAKGA